MPGHEMKRFQSEHSDFQEIVAFHIFRFAQLPLEGTIWHVGWLLQVDFT